MIAYDDNLTERWIRIPRKGLCPYSGLSRKAMYSLVNAKKVQSGLICPPGQSRPTRLVWLPSLLEAIKKEMAIAV